MSEDIQKAIRIVEFDRSELSRYAEKLGAGKSAVEKDLLISIFFLLLAYDKQFSPFVKKAVFRGGTCIRKAYYPNEARFSEDLDFASLTLDEMSSFHGALENLTDQELGVTTINGAKKIYSDSRGLDIRLDYTSVLGQPNHIMLNLSTNSPMREVRGRTVEVLPYFRSFKPVVLVMDIREIAAEKLRALLQRVKPRDVYDVWFLISKKGMRIDHAMLKEKLMKSYLAAPEGKKESAASYSHDKINKRMEALTSTSWKQELGGLLTRASPPREVIMADVSKTLKKIGDITLEPE